MKIKISLAQVILAVIVIYFVYLIREDLLKLNELRGEKLQLVQHLKLEESAQEALKREAPDFEEIARTRLGFIKKGEMAYKVILKQHAD